MRGGGNQGVEQNARETNLPFQVQGRKRKPLTDHPLGPVGAQGPWEESVVGRKAKCFVYNHVHWGAKVRTGAPNGSPPQGQHYA